MSWDLIVVVVIYQFVSSGVLTDGGDLLVSVRCRVTPAAYTQSGITWAKDVALYSGVVTQV